MGFSSAGDVGKAINARVKLEARQLSGDERDTILAVMLDQCDALIKSYWELAVSGSVKDAEFVLRTIMGKAKLAQLDMPDITQHGQTVLVVSGDSEEEYVKALRGGQATENSD